MGLVSLMGFVIWGHRHGADAVGPLQTLRSSVCSS